MFDSVSPIIAGSLQELKIRTYISVTSAVFLIYEYLLMLASEVQYVWHIKWGVGKVLYLLSRYPLLVISVLELYRAPGHIVSTAECRVLSSISSYTQMFAVSIAEVILAIRVWALWQRKIWLTAYFAFVIAGGVTITLVSLVKAVQSETYVSDSTSIESLSYPGCLIVNENGKSLYSSYIMLVLHGAIVFLLMAIIWYKSFHHSVRFSSMMYTFYRDGVIYFAAMLAISTANMIFDITQPPEYVNFLTPIQAAVHSVLSTRMLLNLRQSAQRDLSGVNSILDSNTRHRITRLRFATGVDSSAVTSAA
ncbi:hypothetical protein PTI98_004415 [Pleurotus ostreatus]|nr:hypothetical protein PTI98_004415 [Pleurotus ostreatus]